MHSVNLCLHPLRGLDNVTLTPHNGYVNEADYKVGGALDNLRDVISDVNLFLVFPGVLDENGGEHAIVFGGRKTPLLDPLIRTGGMNRQPILRRLQDYNLVAPSKATG
ncbi:hypothetical protein D9757_007930 [Collybiopsis confluens]|uniref:Uncharacterized protein n=1 Tax=Collybiopsis confluens TaxID=2823264 RepID=A0A8H5HBT2_9AGAR|nr:hypothetical protein D9757_007930 [Collybiopsis confluens]